MKTWIFDEQTLDAAIAAWVENQIASGHPKAVANAAFVGMAIKDMLESSPKLFKDPKPAETQPTTIIPSKPSSEKADTSSSHNKHDIAPHTQPSNFSIEDMKKAWYGE